MEYHDTLCISVPKVVEHHLEIHLCQIVLTLQATAKRCVCWSKQQPMWIAAPWRAPLLCTRPVAMALGTSPSCCWQRRRASTTLGTPVPSSLPVLKVTWNLVKLLLRHCDQGHDGQLGALAPAVATLEDPQLVEQVLRMMRKRREADDEELVTRATTRLKCSFRRTGWRPTEGWNGFKVDSKVDPNRLKRRVRLCWKESVLLCWSEGVGAVLYVGVCRWSSTSDTRNVLKLRVLLQRRQLHETQMIKLPKAHNVKLSAMKSDSGWPMACRASWTLNGIWSGWRMSAWRKGSRSFKLHIVKWSWTVEDVVLPWRYIPHFTTAV